MKGKIQDYCKLGIVHFMLYKAAGSGEGDILKSIDTICSDTELDAIEVTWVKDKGQRAEVAARLKESGKAVGFGAHPIIIGQGLDLNHEDPAIRRKAVDTIKPLVEQAYDLGCCGFVVLSGKDPGDAKRPAARQYLMESLLEIDQELKRQGNMPLVLESFDRVVYGKNCLKGPHAYCADFARDMRKKAPDFGILADLSHIPLLDESPADAVKSVRDVLVHAHIGNCVKGRQDHEMYGDKHPPLCDPDGINGVQEVAEYLKALFEIGFLDSNKRPILSFEVCTYKDWSAERLLRQSKDVTYEAFQKI